MPEIIKLFFTRKKVLTFLLNSSEEFNIIVIKGGNMPTHKFDGIRGAIAVVTNILGINETYLAGFLGVTEKSLNEWKRLGSGELTPKAKRLKRLYEVIEFIRDQYPKVSSNEIKSVLENGRITIDPDDEEDGTTALLSFILAEPEFKYWPAIVKEAVEDYLASKPAPRMKSLAANH